MPMIIVPQSAFGEQEVIVRAFCHGFKNYE